MKTLPTIIAAVLVASADAAEQFDAVDHGRKVFESMGCIVCHATDDGDLSAKTGPNLYGLFASERDDIEIVDAKSGGRAKVSPDKAYFKRAVRDAARELAIATGGPFSGQPYPPAMPSFAKEVITDQDLESIWHYLRTLAVEGKAGPAVVMMNKQQAGAVDKLVQIDHELPVDQRARVVRARLPGMSGRAVYVGLPGHVNYGFDPRMLSVRKVWSGGFLNLKEERSGRGGRPSTTGHLARVVLDGAPLLAPLTSAGHAVDFEFKEPDVGDEDAIIRHLHDDVDFLHKLGTLNAEFLGYRVPSGGAGVPVFRFRVGANQIEQSLEIADDGALRIAMRAHCVEPQSFRLRADGLANVRVDGGVLGSDGVWTLPVSGGWEPYALTAKIDVVVPEMLPVGAAESADAQPLRVVEAKSGRMEVKLPPGYSLFTWEPPLDLFGRQQLFEPTGIDVAKDGTIVLSTRTAGVWRIRNGNWSLFAEGIFESLGVCIEDDCGDRIVVGQKPELTRISDTDGDGRADSFDTLCDDYGFHADYHEYTHGPVRDGDGSYYFTLNLAHSPNTVASWRGGSGCMGSMGGYRGWACKVTADGRFEPVAGGLRSPAGIGIDPGGRIWYAENQGDYVGSSKLVPLEKGAFYGHVAALTDLPGMKPDAPGLTHDHWRGKLRKGAVWLPQSRLSNSPGHPVWDLTGGSFGPYGGQCFIGDQTQSRVMRVVTEQVDGADQGVVMPFMEGLASGAMRPCFLPDGSLLIGQTGRGWGAKGGHQAALQQIVWDGKTVPSDIHKVSAAKQGFHLHFSQPLSAAVDAASLVESIGVESWTYINSPRYGSPEEALRKDVVEGVIVAPDRKSVTIVLQRFGQGDGWLDRIYQIQLGGAAQAFDTPPAAPALKAWFTLRAVAP